MTDRPDPPEAPEVVESPAAAEIRRLLAEARHTEPIPAEVAARLDGVLTRLGDETPSVGHEPRDRPLVVPIAPHRRRNAAALLVAAAAIVVGGVVLAPHVHVRPHGVSAGASSGSDQGEGGALSAPRGSKQPQAAHGLPGSIKLRDGRLVVRPGSFDLGAQQGLRLLRTPAYRSSPEAAPCAGVPRHVESVAAEYQHAPAVLVYRQAEGSAQVVDLYVCGNSRPIRSTTLSVP